MCSHRYDTAYDAALAYDQAARMINEAKVVSHAARRRTRPVNFPQVQRFDKGLHARLLALFKAHPAAPAPAPAQHAPKRKLDQTDVGRSLRTHALTAAAAASGAASHQQPVLAAAAGAWEDAYDADAADAAEAAAALTAMGSGGLTYSAPQRSIPQEQHAGAGLLAALAAHCGIQTVPSGSSRAGALLSGAGQPGAGGEGSMHALLQPAADAAAGDAAAAGNPVAQVLLRAALPEPSSDAAQQVAASALDGDDWAGKHAGVQAVGTTQTMPASAAAGDSRQPASPLSQSGSVGSAAAGAAAAAAAANGPDTDSRSNGASAGVGCLQQLHEPPPQLLQQAQGQPQSRSLPEQLQQLLAQARNDDGAPGAQGVAQRLLLQVLVQHLPQLQQAQGRSVEPSQAQPAHPAQGTPALAGQPLQPPHLLRLPEQMLPWPAQQQLPGPAPDELQWQPELDTAAAVLPGAAGAEAGGMLARISSSDLLSVANSCLHEIVDMRLAVLMAPQDTSSLSVLQEMLAAAQQQQQQQTRWLPTSTGPPQPADEAQSARSLPMAPERVVALSVMRVFQQLLVETAAGQALPAERAYVLAALNQLQSALSGLQRITAAATDAVARDARACLREWVGAHLSLPARTSITSAVGRLAALL